MRGKFIVFEGLDRCGKSTMARTLAQNLKNQGQVQLICFPNRKSKIGELIDGYLKSTTNLSNEAIHLLFSANRWEVISEIEDKLNKGINIVCDRYFYSGVAYSAAKGLDLEWCKQADKGLLVPDIVFFLEADPQYLAKRSGFGEERFQKVDFQQKVYSSFQAILKEQPRAVRIDVTNISLEELEKKIFGVLKQHKIL